MDTEEFVDEVEGDDLSDEGGLPHEDLDDPVYEDTEDTKTLSKADEFSLYLKDMKNIPVLSREEEFAASREMEASRKEIYVIIRDFPIFHRIHREMTRYSRKKGKLETPEEEAEREKHNVNAAILKTADALEQIFQKNRKKKYLAAAVRKETGLEPDAAMLAWKKICTQRNLFQKAKDHLVIHNLRLVISIAKGFARRAHHLSMLDLIQEGNIGLIKAADRFLHERGNKFSTIATYWIKQAIARAITNKEQTIRVSVHMQCRYRKILDVTAELARELNRLPSDEEVAERIGVTQKWVTEARIAMSHDPVSLQDPIGEDSQLADFIVDENALQSDDAAEKHKMIGQVRTFLQTLSPKEKLVFRLRSGIDSPASHTLEQIATELGVTRERVRQIEIKVMIKLKIYAMENGWKSSQGRSLLSIGENEISIGTVNGLKRQLKVRTKARLSAAVQARSSCQMSGDEWTILEKLKTSTPEEVAEDTEYSVVAIRETLWKAKKRGLL